MRNCFKDTTPDDRIKTGPEARQTLADPLNINTCKGGADMSRFGDYGDSTPKDKPEQNETWQSIGALARALAEKSGGNQ
jgi:hypothetical protein